MHSANRPRRDFKATPRHVDAAESNARSSWKLFPVPKQQPPDALAHNAERGEREREFPRAINTIYDAGPIQAHAAACAVTRAVECDDGGGGGDGNARHTRRDPEHSETVLGSRCVSGGGSSVSGSPTTSYLGGMGGGGGGHTPGSSSPGSEMSPQHNESPPAPSWPGEMKHHPHPHAPPHTHHHPHTPGHHPPPPPPPPHHAGYMPQYSWYQADPNPGLLT